MVSPPVHHPGFGAQAVHKFEELLPFRIPPADKNRLLLDEQQRLSKTGMLPKI